MEATGPTREYGAHVGGVVPHRDLALAAAVVVGAEVEIALLDLHPKAVAVPMAALAGAALAFRRRWPVPVVVACVGALVADTLAGVPQDAPTLPLLWLLISLYSGGRHTAWRQSLQALAAALVLFAVTLTVDTSDVVFGLVVVIAPWLVGRGMRASATEASAQAVRAEELARSRDVDVRAAAAAERGRIARELHDVISHSVTVMVVQAGAAAEVVEQDPVAAGRAMQDVQDVGRQALRELATLLGVLRTNEQEEVGLAPQPSVADLAQLVRETEAAGVPASLCVEGSPRPLPASVEVNLYRIAQEALTNVCKHARDARATVTLRYGPEEVGIEVIDDGRVAGSTSGGQHGLTGMRERVELLGGSFAAAPREPTGFVVRASIPCGPS